MSRPSGDDGREAAPGIKSTCPYCGVGCGVRVVPDGAGGAAVTGDPEHPANFGRLCSKGTTLGETLGLTGRLLVPHIAGRRSGWDEAIATVAGRLSTTLDRHGPDAVAFYLSGQLLTEDYYVANKLAKGFLGTANVDTNSRLCMASSVAGHRRAFGADTVPGVYEDLEQADLVLLVGANLAWCHPVLFQRLAAARAARGTKVVVIDPRVTATCELADLHLALAPGTDVALFSALLLYLDAVGAIDRHYVDAHTRGLAAALAAARADVAAGLAPIEAAAARCGLPPGDVARAFALFATTPRVVTVFSQGVNQSASGTDKVNAIINLHLATGRIGRPGMGPFSVTGQPNAMGGREVGGLANQLAAHMGFDDPADRDRVRRFWGAPRLAERPGLKAIELFEAIADRRIRFLWVMGTNPAVSLPDAGRVRGALAGCETVVVSDGVADTDTARLAHVLLPAPLWGEKDGTVTNSERRISRQRAALPLPGLVRPNWWALSRVAAALGHRAAFAYDGPAAIFREHAALSGFENAGRRDFDIGACASLTDAGYDGLQPFQWPLPAGTDPADRGALRLFGDGHFFTGDGRAEFVAISYRPPVHPTSPAYPFVLNTARTRDQWHTMTRTGLVPALMSHRPEPVLELHVDDLDAAGLEDGGLARVASAWGEVVLRVRATEGARRGVVTAPMHWTDRFQRGGPVQRAVNPATDPLSGQPESKHTPVALTPVARSWHGLLVADRPLDERRLDAVAGWWTRAPVEGGWSATLVGLDAGPTAPDADQILTAADPLALLLGADLAGERLELRDRARGLVRQAVIAEGRVAAVLMLSAGALPAREVVAARLGTQVSDADRARLLAGIDGCGGVAAAGPLVCSCLRVGENRLVAAIRDGATSVEAVGAVLGAGTHCGSCVPEIRAALRREVRHAA